MSHSWFSTKLLRWFQERDRNLPWKGTQDPYRIWLSEIILQQTRVAQGTPYYLRFVEKYPTVQDLARAPEQEVFKLWEGLGYYNRARHLLHTARYIAFERGGRFPDTYSGLLELKGVGPYTAAAIGSFAFHLPTAVVDGNVFRVLARVFDLDTPIQSSSGKTVFQELAQSLIDPDRPGDYNQAIMDLGATLCTPRSPDCPACPLQDHCLARERNTISERPVRAKSLGRRKRYFHYQYIQDQGKTWIRKRSGKDIWRGLFEFPLIETEGPEIEKDRIYGQLDWLPSHREKGLQLVGKSKVFEQILSHQVIHAQFWIWTWEGEPVEEAEHLLRVEINELEVYPWPRLFSRFWADLALTLDLSDLAEGSESALRPRIDS